MNLVFFGSGEFAVPLLEGLARSPYVPRWVVTTTDRPQGRGRKFAPSPVKKTAVKMGLPLLEMTVRRDPAILSLLGKAIPDLGILADFSFLLPPELLAFFRKGVLNLHPSLLPRHRGAAPIQQAILDGDDRTGNSVILLTPRLDAGPILKQEIRPLTGEETFAGLREELSVRGLNLMLEILSRLDPYLAEAREQDPAGWPLTRKLEKKQGILDWSKSADRLAREIRAFLPWPGSSTFLLGENQPVRCFLQQASALPETEVPAALRGEPPGALITSGVSAGASAGVPAGASAPLAVRCGQGLLIVRQLQREGKKVLDASAFLCGARLGKGARFGTP